MADIKYGLLKNDEFVLMQQELVKRYSAQSDIARECCRRVEIAWNHCHYQGPDRLAREKLHVGESNDQRNVRRIHEFATYERALQDYHKSTRELTALRRQIRVPDHMSKFKLALAAHIREKEIREPRTDRKHLDLAGDYDDEPQ